MISFVYVCLLSKLKKLIPTQKEDNDVLRGLKANELD